MRILYKRLNNKTHQLMWEQTKTHRGWKQINISEIWTFVILVCSFCRSSSLFFFSSVSLLTSAVRLTTWEEREDPNFFSSLSFCSSCNGGEMKRHLNYIIQTQHHHWVSSLLMIWWSDETVHSQRVLFMLNHFSFTVDFKTTSEILHTHQ